MNCANKGALLNAENDDLAQCNSRTKAKNFDSCKAYPKKAEILIVEDEKDFCELLGDYLWDYDILKAENGEKALALYKEHCPDLILTDMIMPKMGGAELIAEIAKYSTPIIAFSGYEIKADSYDYFLIKEETREFFTKPIDLEELRSSIEKLLKKV